MITIIEIVQTVLDLGRRWWITMIVIGVGSMIISEHFSGTQEFPTIRAPSVPYKTDYEQSDELQQLMINTIIYQDFSSDPVSEAEITRAPGPEVPLSKPFRLR